ncbi:hypothetical protein [Thalassospira tepidiphila]|uniref:Uncharacterized protein n=2 Tax=Thalassospira tepidiphila TaxID=393657 RepID=A0A853L049_9PROT|nr:hypothetical protein [Thalassospira tepidiphila]NJB74814.1 hypothetical protein [Thalassospira tepidiphila]OAZ10219.1 hypothetical protein TH4_08185 [Thalassospira tepidiphila MCCC 1A03514]
MSMRKIAKCLPAIGLGLALSGCMAPVEEPVTMSNSSGTIVTPWGAPAQNTRLASPSTMTGSTSAGENDNLIMMDDPNRKAMDEMRQKQIDEARIALGILDRMAQRCVQSGDAAACTTLQTNWSTLSQQLHKTLSMMSGDTMQMPNSVPTDDPAMPAMNDSAPMSPAPVTPPATTGAPAGGDIPTMEKTIPMTEPGADG